MLWVAGYMQSFETDTAAPLTAIQLHLAINNRAYWGGGGFAKSKVTHELQSLLFSPSKISYEVM
jgi:hypothetical protein